MKERAGTRATPARPDTGADAGRKPPRVSVIVICYDNGPYIAQALGSVLAQTFADLELVVVDDGSTDGSLDTIRAVAAKDPRVVVLTQPNSGRPCFPRNAGLRVARGEFVCFLDGDDAYCPEKLARELALFERQPDLDVVFHDVTLVDAAGRAQARTYLQEADYLRHAGPHLVALDAECYASGPGFASFTAARLVGIHVSSIMARRSALDRAGPFDERPETSFGDDSDMWYRLVLGGRVGYIDQALSLYRRHAAAFTASNRRVLRYGVVVHRRNYERTRNMLLPADAVHYHRRIRDLYLTLGYACVRDGDAREARAWYREAMKWRPGWRPLLLWAKSFAPRRFVGRDWGAAWSGARLRQGTRGRNHKRPARPETSGFVPPRDSR